MEISFGFWDGLHQNEAKAIEAITDAKAHCAATIKEVETHCTTHIREAEADCASIVIEVKPAVLLILEKWSPTVQNMAVPSNNHMQRVCNRSHGRGGERPPLLPNCLWNGIAGLPPEAHGALISHLHSLMGYSWLLFWTFPLRCLPLGRNLPLWFPMLLLQQYPGLPLGPNNNTIHPNQVVSSPQSGDEAVGTSKELPCLRQKDNMPFTKSLKGGQWEAFAKDSDLVQARKDYFKTNHPCFDHKTLCNLSGFLWDMITYADL